MKKIRILLAALLVAATCLVATPASSSAATVNLTITCHQGPATCIGVGQIGPLFAVTGVSAPGAAAAIVCLDPVCSTGALLVATPHSLFGVAQLDGLALADLSLTAHSSYVDVFTHNIYLTLFGNYGIVGVLVLTPGHTVCLGLDHLKLFTTGC